jgi:hypothetical protein
MTRSWVVETETEWLIVENGECTAYREVVAGGEADVGRADGARCCQLDRDWGGRWRT